MNEKEFLKTIKSLSYALIEDFRGFLVEGCELIEVPDDMLHLHIAFQEMAKIPGWKYESGTGQNPTIEYMRDKKAIYITKIPDDICKGNYQRTVGYLTDSYSDIISYRGLQQPQYEVIKKIALGMGYDVDEYTLQEKTESSVKTPVSITTYKGNIHVRKTNLNLNPTRNISEGDRPVFGPNNKVIGFISKGKFVNINNYKRYAVGSTEINKNLNELDNR